MTVIYLPLGCLLLIVSSLLLRNATKLQRSLSLVAFIIASMCFIAIYGNIAGVIVAIAAGLLIGLLTALALGKPIK